MRYIATVQRPSCKSCSLFQLLSDNGVRTTFSDCSNCPHALFVDRRENVKSGLMYRQNLLVSHMGTLCKSRSMLNDTLERDVRRFRWGFQVQRKGFSTRVQPPLSQPPTSTSPIFSRVYLPPTTTLTSRQNLRLISVPSTGSSPDDE